MQPWQKIKAGVRKHFLSSYKDAAPAKAYDIWAGQYDAQPDNLMLALDEQIFEKMFSGILLQDKTIVDIGCGTGRHWPKIYAGHPATLSGYDVSEGMLLQLKNKFPSADTHLIADHLLPNIGTGTCDIVLSTLTVAHIENLNGALNEWYRILKPKGDIVITDYHPELLAKGGDRSFKHNGKYVSVKNHVHPIAGILEYALHKELEVIRIEELMINETMLPYYEKQNALHVFEKYKGTPVIYGLHLRKK